MRELPSPPLPPVDAEGIVWGVSRGSIDPLTLARRLRDRAGFAPEHAEEAAQAIAEALNDRLVTRDDLQAEVARLEGRIAESKSDLTRLVLTVASGQTALLLAAMFSLARSAH